ncbi:sodium:proton antiporter [Hydrogenovibrio sp. 3SP14C1]|uniref:cation:proton antiporter n=1 Tax=Hydrogenovibrio sp. 3SP14C1 TaxID=3038774 RepID=UPI002416AD54|nr:sodium:proton antiporter [Hydrogenovibrio sp. 3SP14C1]MDG4812770.1 sodium:proton antiporter [Hydrogenovibrio sp. 3SP14C1]
MFELLSIPLQLTLLVLLGMLSQWLGWKLRLPAIIFLLLVGILLGPVLDWLNPDVLLGDLLFPFVSLGVAIILFEGSLTLRFSEIKGVKYYIRNLTTLGVLITWMVMAIGAHYLAALDWPIAFLFGAIVTVTGPTVIMPMLRSMKITERVGSVLRWEGIIIDPIGAMLAILVYVYIVSSKNHADILLTFIQLIGIGSFLGFLGGWILAKCLKNHWIPNYLTNFFSLTVVLLMFTVSNQISHESGLVAVTVMGVYLANQKDVSMHSILDFKEHLTVLLISLLFIVLAARMDFELLFSLSWSALLLLVVAQFIARPLSVFISTIGGKELKLNELILLSWISPRGIVAAAISALFAIRLEDNGIPGAETILPLVFIMIMGTVLFQSLSAGLVARKLKLSHIDTQGALIVGANKVSIAVAQALKDQGLEVMIATQSRTADKETKMHGIKTYYGDLLSKKAELYLDINPYKVMLLMDFKSELHPLYYTHFRSDFGPENIYALSTVPASEISEEKSLSTNLNPRVLFGDNVTWPKLSNLINQGAEVRVTNITNNFSFKDYQEHWQDKAIPLFAISPKEEFYIFAEDSHIKIETGWKIGSLVLETKKN